MVIGAHCAGKYDAIETLRMAGRLVGIAFQLRDDILDYGSGNSELNIVSILEKSYGGEAVKVALGMLNRNLSYAVELLSNVGVDEGLLRYIQLLRLECTHNTPPK